MFNKLKKTIVFYLPIIKIVFNNPTYIKYIPSWRKSPLDIEVPWVNFDTKEWLDKHLNKNMVVFEYGSGGSTLYFSRRVKKIISIEHNPEWFARVKNKLMNKGITNYEYYCYPPEEIHSDDDKIYLSTDSNYKNKNFRRYVEKINEYPDNFFDLVVIDGRARNGCMNNVLTKVKNNGYILLDNSDRDEYLPGISIFSKLEVIKYFGPGYSANGLWGGMIWVVKK
jgi:hypothetical protein